MASSTCAGGVGLLEPIAEDRPAVELAHGRRQLVAEVAGLLDRRRGHEQHHPREEHAPCRRRPARPPTPVSARSGAARRTTSGDSATPTTRPTAMPVTMSGAIVTMAQIAAASAAARGEHDHRRRVRRRRAGSGATRLPTPSPGGRLTLGTVRRDEQPDGDRGAAVGPAHPGGGAHDRRHDRRARSSPGACSWPPTGRCRGRRPRVVAAVHARPRRRPPRRPHPAGTGRPAHLRGVGAPSASGPPTSCSTRWSRPSTGSRRRRPTPPRPSRTAPTASASWRATSSSPTASPTACNALAGPGHRAATTCSAPPPAPPPPTSCAPSSPCSS